MKKNIIIFLAAVLILFLSAGRGFCSGTFSSVPVLEGKFGEYKVKPGEDLYPIARSHGLAIEHIMYANGMTGIKANPGQILLLPTKRIPPASGLYEGVVLNLPERGIYLFKDGKVKKFYPVAIGAPGRWMTPTGDMKIITKVKNPVWLPPEWAKEENPVPAGPDNPLGDRWMGLDRPGYGIHATNSPVSIGLAASHGCMRMYPEMAHDLFDQVYVNMPVRIVYEPVKIGYDPEEKRVFLEVYGDVYGKTPDLLGEARRLLARHNLLGLVDENRLRQVVERKRGIPEAVLGTDIVIKINDARQNLSFSPISKDGKILVTSQILKPMGAVLSWNNKNKVVDIYRGDRKVSLKVSQLGGTVNSGKDPATAYLWNGRTIIPLSYVLQGLGVNYYWIAEYRTVLIYSDTGRKPPKVPGKVKNGKDPKTAPTPAPSTSPSPDAPLPTVVPDDLPPADFTPVPESSPSPEPSPSPSKAEPGA